MADMSEIPEIAIILVAGLTVFGLIFIADSANLDGIGTGSSQPDRMTFLNQNFGEVGTSRPDFRTIDLGDFTVGEARGDIKVYEQDRATISDSLLGGNSVKFRYNATQPRDGNVSFEVLGREGRGKVFVKVNGEQVFSEYLVATGSPEVEVPSRALKPGVNRFVVGVKNSGIIGKTQYSIEEVEATVNDRKFHDYEDSFRMYQYELADFTSATLNFQVADSVKTSPLKIEVNGDEVYSKAQVSGPDEIGLSPQNGNLNVGGNSLEFSTEKPAMYSIRNAQITTKYVGNAQEERLTTRFEMNNSQRRFAGRDSTREYIEFNYRSLMPEPRQLTVNFNGNTTTFIPANGRNTIDIQASQLRDENTVTISSPGTYQLNNFRVVSERVE